MSEHRPDDELGAELRDLPLPEHKPGFWERLDRRLEAEDAVGGSAGRRAGGAAPLGSVLVRYLPLLVAAIVLLVIVVLVLR